MDNSFKQKLQEREFQELKDKYRVALKWATGCGKSKMAIDLLNHAAGNYRKGMKVLFVVAERAHINNWLHEIFKWKLNAYTEVICYASLHHKKGETFDAIVFDEAHHAFTEKRMDIIKTIQSSYVYLLSATLPSSKIEEMEEIYGKFTTSTVTLKDAIKNDILPDPRIYVIELHLDDKKSDQEIAIGKPDRNAPIVRWEDRNKYVFRNTPCIIKCTQKQKYDFLTSRMEYWKSRYQMSHNEYQKNQWVSLGSQRKRFIGELKTDYVRNLIDTFPRKRRFVCFCATVAQANLLSEENTISSKRPSQLNQAIIDAFNKKKLSQIYAVGMITEGMNLTKIEAGIITQLDGKERLFIQKAGRVLRADDPVAYIFYYKNTQDEVYLKNALENIDEKYVKYINNDY